VGCAIIWHDRYTFSAGTSQLRGARFKRINQRRRMFDPTFSVQFVEVFPEVFRNHPQPTHFAAVVLAALGDQCRRGT
jgi:hypothetical protein